MSVFKKHRALLILGWFVALFTFNVLLDWWQNADKRGAFIFIAAIERLMTLPELLLAAVVVYIISSRRQVISTARLATYTVIGLIAIAVTLIASGQMNGRNFSGWILKGYGRLRSPSPLSPMQVFQRVSPSVFVVEAFGQNGESLELGSGVAIAPNLLITNCHVVETSYSLRISRDDTKWAATLVQAIPNHDLCGLRPGGLTLLPISVRSSSTLETGESVYAIGAPEGLELTFSQGVISALREADGGRMIQTSAPTSPGSSGGGLFDGHGNLVGITAFQFKEGQSLNFALPGEWVTDVLTRSSNSAQAVHPDVSDAALESSAWIAIGVAATNLKNYELAENTLLKAIRLQQPDAYRAWYELGNMYRLQLHREAQAVASFGRAIQLKPNYADAWRELAQSYLTQKNFDQAIVAAKESTQLDAHDKNNWQLLGMIYFKNKSYAEAVDACQQGLQIAPGDEILLLFMGAAYGKEGDRQQVIRIYTQLKEKSPWAAELLFKEFVLPHPTTVRAKKMSQEDQLISILNNAPIDNATRRDAMDAFYQASSPDDFVARINKLNILDTIKQSLWDLRFGVRKP